MTTTKMISLSAAQYRMLGRAIRGHKFPLTRYRQEHATVRALADKGCWTHHHGHWTPTDLGKKIFASRGVLRSGHSVWDSASHAEREAYKAAVRRGDADDVAQRLRDRMAAAGELPS